MEIKVHHCHHQQYPQSIAFVVALAVVWAEIVHYSWLQGYVL